MILLEGAPQVSREFGVGAPRRFVLGTRRMLGHRSGDPRPSERVPPAAVACRVVVCVVVGLVLTSCGAGQIAQTATQQAAVKGAPGDVGDVALRDVWMPSSPDPSGTYPVGSTVPVLATIINSGGAADELVAVTSPVADRVQVSGTVRIPPGRNVVSDADPSASRSPLVAGKLQIVVVTAHVLRLGTDTPMTFHFRNAGQVTLQVPQAEAAQGVGRAGSNDQGE